jgi:uncharacterized protein (DUF1501 family)
MRTFAEAVDAFMQDLVKLNKQDDVVIMVFSEFGRRAQQNGSGGTDHGAAEPMFVIGNTVNGGLYGAQPSLLDLDPNGDIKYKVDFRSVYAGLVRDQLGADPTSIVGAGFQPLATVKSAPAPLTVAA